MARKKPSAFNAELLVELLDGQDPATVLHSDGLLGELKRALAERMLNAEMDVPPLGRVAAAHRQSLQWYEPQDRAQRRGSD